jgi:hypothetical protein
MKIFSIGLLELIYITVNFSAPKNLIKLDLVPNFSNDLRGIIRSEYSATYNQFIN